MLLFCLLWTAQGLSFAYPVTYASRTDSIEDVAWVGEGIARAYDPARRLAIGGIGALGLLSLSMPRRAPVRHPGALGNCATVLLAWATLSPAWADDPSMAARRVAVLLLVVLGALGVASVMSPKWVVQFAFWSCSGIVVLSLVAEVGQGTFAPLAAGYRLAGVQHPTGLAQACCVVIVVAATGGRHVRPRWGSVLLAGVSLAAMLMTRSRGPLVALVAALCAALFVRLGWRGRARCLLGAGALLTASLMLGEFTSSRYTIEALSLGRADSEMSTLTGRIPLWSECLQYLAERPILGFGYGTFWTVQRFEDVAKATGFRVADVHSSYIDVAIGLGIPGGVLLLAVVGLALRAVVRDRHSDAWPTSVALVTALAINMFLLTILGYPQVPGFVSMLLIAQAGVCRRERVEG